MLEQIFTSGNSNKERTNKKAQPVCNWSHQTVCTCKYIQYIQYCAKVLGMQPVKLSLIRKIHNIATKCGKKVLQ